MERHEIERQKERKKAGKVRKYNTFWGVKKCSMNGTKIKNPNNREQSQQDHLREESEINW